MTANYPITDPIVFVDASHQKYRRLNQALAGLGVPVFWVCDTRAALFLVRTTRVSLVICDAMSMNAAWREFLAEIRRVSPETDRLVTTVFSGSADKLGQLIDSAGAVSIACGIGNAPQASHPCGV